MIAFRVFALALLAAGDPVVSTAASTPQLKWSDPYFQSLTEKEKGRIVMDTLDPDSHFLRGKLPPNRDQERSLNIANVGVFTGSTPFETAAPLSLLTSSQTFAGSGGVPEGCGADPLVSGGSTTCGAIVEGLVISSNGGGGLVSVGPNSIAKDSMTTGFISLTFSPPVDAIAINFSPLLQGILGPVTVTVKNSDGATLHSFDHELAAGPNFLGFVKPVPGEFDSFASIELGVAGQVPFALSSVVFGDADKDDDGVHDIDDNCLDDFNPSQTNTDSDSNGDVCDECPTNGAFQEDTEDPMAICKSATATLSGNSAMITSADIDDGSSDTCGNGFSLAINTDTFDCSDVGTSETVLTVTDTKGMTATCSAVVTVVDNENPEVACNDLTIEVDAYGGGSALTVFDIKGSASDNCAITSETLSVFDPTCGNVGQNSVTLEVADQSGNSASCTATVTVQDTTAPTCTAQDVSVSVTAAGGPGMITAASVDDGSTDNCPFGPNAFSLSQDSFGCGAAGAGLGDTTVTLTVSDANGNQATCGSIVTVQDTDDPTATCIPSGAPVALDGTGSVTIQKGDVGSATDEGCGVATTNGGEAVTYGCNQLGDQTITFEAVDYGGNEASCSTTVTVIDDSDPIPVCTQDPVVVELDATGAGTVTAADIDTGSTDNCGPITYGAIENSAFGCSDVGATLTSTLVMSDPSENAATCDADIMVVDVIKPTPVCQNPTVSLDSLGMATISATDVGGGSTDNCGVQGLSLDVTTFNCADVGDNPVTMTVTDVNSNSESCTATVTIEDDTDPVAECVAAIDLALSNVLGGNGAATLTASAIEDGSDDACGIASLAVSQESFGCADAAAPAATVTMTVTDNNGNENTCTSAVTTKDEWAPSIACVDTSLPIVAACLTANIQIADALANADDNCGVTGESLDDSSPVPLGSPSKIVEVTVVDAAYNAATCQSTITVTNTPPVAICSNELETSSTTITAADIDNGSYDPDPGCMLSLGLDKMDDFTVCQPTTVTLTVTDPYGSSSSCTSSVVSAPTGTPRSVTIAGAAPGMEIRIQGVTSNPNFQSVDGLTVLLNAEQTYRYKIRVNNKATPGWLEYTVPLDCAPELSVANDFTTVVIEAPNGVEVQIQGTGSPLTKLVNGGTMVLPKMLNIRYRVVAGGVNGPWVPDSGQNVGGGSTYTLNVNGDVSTVTVKIASGPQGDGARVRYPQSNAGTLYADGETFLLPKDALARYRVVVNEKASANIDFTPTATANDLDTVADFGSFVLNNIPADGPRNTESPAIQFQGVTKRIGAGGNTIWFPAGFTAKWRPRVNGYVEPNNWNQVAASRTVTVTTAAVPIDGTELFCTVTVECTTVLNLANIGDCTTARADLLPANQTPNQIADLQTVVLLTNKAIEYRVSDSATGNGSNLRYDYNPGVCDGGTLNISQ